jgi:RNA polymerase sigma factor (TIGR02999 family)
MGVEANHAVTVLLRAAAGGDPAAVDRLYAHVYPQFRRLARLVRRGRAGETLNTTALVHEAWLKLARGDIGAWRERAHFFAVAARAMRHVLVDAARRRIAHRRGGAAAFVITLDEAGPAAPVRAAELVALDDALTRLAAIAPRRAAVVEQRFFAGLTTDETAAVLDVSTATVEREWRAARAWLATELTAP